jgi:hypothetical protein
MATTENLSTLKMHKLSQKQYDDALAEGKIKTNEFYLTPDNNPEIRKVTQEEYDQLPEEDKLNENILYLTPDTSDDGWNSITYDGEQYSGDNAITVADKTEYYFPNATAVELKAPTGLDKYECWIYIGGDNVNSASPVRTWVLNGFSEHVGFDTIDMYSEITGTEISIKDGRYTIGYTGTLKA